MAKEGHGKTRGQSVSSQLLAPEVHDTLIGLLWAPFQHHPKLESFQPMSENVFSGTYLWDVPSAGLSNSIAEALSRGGLRFLGSFHEV